MAYRPLADEIRPTSLDEVVGQRHILGPDGLLRRIIESGSVPNLIFYGPSGVGKTTVANIIARRTQRKLCRLNATTASSADIREIVSLTLAKQNMIILEMRVESQSLEEIFIELTDQSEEDEA